MRKFGIFSAILITSFFIGCSPVEHSKIVVAEYDDSQILMDEFEKAYAKNVGSEEKAKDDSQEMMKKFLDLYVNFKMKLRDAWVRGYYEDPDINKEIDDYQKKVGATYIKERLLVEKGLKKLYDERKYEYRVSHILIRPTTTPGAKTAKEQAQEVIDQINKGKSFEMLCKDYSADQFSRDKGGDVYWLTSGQIGYEWDKAMTSTPVGQIYPKPVRTRFGFHVIKVKDKAERVPQIKASHILIDFKDENGKIDEEKALKLAKEIRQRILNGEDFGELAKKYSKDKGSAAKGGDLGYFKRRMMVQEFDSVAFSLKVGEISEPVKTRFGYHIIKVTDRRAYPSFETEKNTLRKIYDRQRFKTDFADFAEKMKKEFNYQQNKSLIGFVAQFPDSIKFNSEIYDTDFYNAIKDSVIFTIQGEPYTADSLIVFMVGDKEFFNQSLDENKFNRAVDKYAGNVLLTYKAMSIQNEDEGFKELMDDYRNGIYIFKLQESEIWNKIKIDSVEVKKFFEKNRDKYTLPDRVTFYEIFTRNDSLIQSYYKRILNGESFEGLAKKFTERPSKKNTSGLHELTKVTSSVMAQKAWELKNVGDISEPFKAGNGWSIVKLAGKEPARNKTFEEAKAEVLSDYQDYLSKKLEEEYIQKLKDRYDPKYYYEELGKAFKSETN